MRAHRGAQRELRAQRCGLLAEARGLRSPSLRSEVTFERERERETLIKTVHEVLLRLQCFREKISEMPLQSVARNRMFNNTSILSGGNRQRRSGRDLVVRCGSGGGRSARWPEALRFYPREGLGRGQWLLLADYARPGRDLRPPITS